MIRDTHQERTAAGKFRLGVTLPKSLVAQVDVVVALRHMADDWVTRVDVVEECVVRLLEAGGLSATPTRPDPDPEHRKVFRLNMRRDLVTEVYAESSTTQGAGERCPPWKVVAVAIMDHLQAVHGPVCTVHENVSPNPEDDSNQPFWRRWRVSPPA